MDRLEQALARLTRADTTVAVLFCDLDHFKVVNDSLGHNAGDHLLVVMAERLQSVVRPGDTVARFGGDEFVVLCESLEEPSDSVDIANRLAEALRAPVALDGGELVVSASIGIACTRDAIDTSETLLRDADAAMYRAKEQGRDRHALFDTRLRSQAVSRLETERALRQALLRAELAVHYQPEVCLRTGEIRSVEALVRWHAPGMGIVGPDKFLQVAEETGLIVPVGTYVLEAASAEAARWRRELGDAAPVLWVNVSARQLVDPTLLAAVADAVEQLSSPSCLGLEITETALVPDDVRVTRAMEQLAELGVSIALDDFGTGFASLAYLWRFPADVLKIDQTFVAALGHERSATVIVASVVQLAQTLGKTTVGEGVESVAQLSQLRRLGCDTAQGHLLSHPLPADDMAALLRHPPAFLEVTADKPDPTTFGWT
jgi:diguanylate cyclase (GGDEF)-like protein